MANQHNLTPSAEAELQKAIEARRVQSMLMLTDEDCAIIYDVRKRDCGIVARTMIRAERKEGSFAHYVMAQNKFMDGEKATIVDAVALDIETQEINEGRMPAQRVRA